METKIISYDPKKEHISLMKMINERVGNPMSSQEAPLQQALSYIHNLSDKNAISALKKASLTKIPINEDIQFVPKTIKSRVDKSICDDVDEVFSQISNPPLTRIQRPFFVKVILTAFYTHLIEMDQDAQKKGMELIEENEQIDNLLRFNISVKVADMLLKNNTEDTLYINEIIDTMTRREKANKKANNSRRNNVND
ncbi:MAG: hypothetical protein K6G10_01860 [Butyrivibrio sp.]|nr:hypothetical protein [Butyrivibrio sp.]